ncbi:long-chain-fatty-acid--CoA ligase [Rhodococcus opacus]|nr:long-chain-fatty-acid--CoA ligase [Rhodococcus opacus]
MTNVNSSVLDDATFPNGGGTRPSKEASTVDGLMMDTPLTTQMLFRRMQTICGQRRIVTITDDGRRMSQTFEQVSRRAASFAQALDSLGVCRGDRVGSLLWNTQEHVETYYATMGLGAVLHTINPRLHDEQVIYTINHAGDRVIVVDSSLVDQLDRVLDKLASVEHVVIVGDGASVVSRSAKVHRYSEMLTLGEGVNFEWPALEESWGACLCYTSGTTGNPKGVLYTHRAIVLHALTMAGVGGLQVQEGDRVLALVPMFHSLGWGLPFVVTVTGSDLVLPGRNLGPQAVARVIRDERVTWAGGVPTLWMDLLRHVEDPSNKDAVDLSSLRMVLCGGAKVAVPLMQAYDERLSVTLIQGWGMTETLPGAAMSLDIVAPPAERWQRRGQVGRVSPLYEMRIVDVDGSVLPSDGTSVGEVEISGPIVAGSYYGPEDTSDKFHEGWLRTGDLGTLSSDGWLDITDRAKDAIKSGGEWISSQDLESALMAHPAVHEAAVIGVPDPRWSERPAAYVVVSPHGPTDDELREHLRSHVANWWIPEEYHRVDTLPRTSTGKFDKKELRRHRADLAGSLQKISPVENA